MEPGKVSDVHRVQNTILGGRKGELLLVDLLQEASFTRCEAVKTGAAKRDDKGAIRRIFVQIQPEHLVSGKYHFASGPARIHSSELLPPSADLIQLLLDEITIRKVVRDCRIKQARVEVRVLLAHLLDGHALREADSHVVDGDAGTAEARPAVAVAGLANEQ